MLLLNYAGNIANKYIGKAINKEFITRLVTIL